MNMFILTIRTGMPAFSNNNGSLRSMEVANLLRGVARSLENDEPLNDPVETFEHQLFDSDGNVCGELKYAR